MYKEFGLPRFSVIFLPLYVLLYKCGIITNARLKEVFLSKILSGIPIEQLDPVAERFVSYLINKVKQNSNPNIKCPSGPKTGLSWLLQVLTLYTEILLKGLVSDKLFAQGLS